MLSPPSEPGQPTHDSGVEDDRLRLIFTCCHPAVSTDAQIALTLRTLVGLTTPEIARAFLVPEADDGAATRARQAQDPQCGDHVPSAARVRVARADRHVLAVLYLLFNEGYSVTAGAALVRVRLCASRRSDLAPDARCP